MNALVVDDEPNIRRVLNRVLREANCKIYEASSVAAAKDLIVQHPFEISIVDIRLPDGSGTEILRFIRELYPDTVVLIITAFASTETAVAAMKLGAYDYITKPFNLDEIRIILKNVRETISLKKRVNELQQYADEYQLIVGKSDVMKKVFNSIERIAPFETNVLILGATGTGKELVAKAIHSKSRRAKKPFLAINCASLPAELLESELFGYTKGAFTGAYASKQGLIEEANGGTLFLDEIGEMPLSLQAKLLRFLEDKKIRPIGSPSEVEVDVRIVSATNKTLSDLSEKAEFRDDLYYRLSTFIIPLPSLSERREDLPLLIDHFIKLTSRKFQKEITKIDPSLIDYIMHHELKGNVRELKNIIEREIILSDGGCLKCTQADTDVSQSNTFPQLAGTGLNLNEYLSSIEKTLLYNALQEANGVKTKAAQLLGLSFREFRYRLSKYKDSEDVAQHPSSTENQG
ncbi:MAG: sigma-54-dependent transcriptional regulator [Dissulfurispiraceae bacterium]